MLKSLVHTLLSCIVVFCLLVVFPESAWAGRSPRTIAFDATTNVEIVEVYNTVDVTQKPIAKALKANGKAMQKAPGFKGFSIFKSQDKKRVIALSQWQDLESYQAYTSATGSNSSEAAQELPSPTRTLTFELVKTQPSIEGSTSALRGKEAVVDWIEFLPKSGNIQTVVQRVETLIPKVLNKQPVPQSVVLLKAFDNNEVGLLINWNCSAMFEDLGKPTTIAIDNDITALADSDQRFYDVTQIIPIDTRKSSDKESEYY